MVTGADIAGATLTVTRTLDTLKKCKELAENANDLETKEIILELRAQLVDTKSVLIDAKEEINNQKEKVSQLQKQLSERDKVTYSVFDNVYYKDGESVPLCPTCFESEAKLIHLQEIPPSVNSHYSLSNLKCHNCSSYFYLPNFGSQKQLSSKSH